MKNSFIDSVREYITKEFPDLQKVEIIVPNNRTGAALLSSLKENSTKVGWAPKITAIKDIFYRNTKLHEAESIVLVYLLYKIYNSTYGDSNAIESFDRFYSFGEVLLSDFDDIDKYLVNPEKLFSNIADEKKIDIEFADISKELMEILQTFWNNVSESVLENKEKSLELWNKMPTIYKEFTASLRERNIGYQGMIYRDFVENWMEKTSFDAENYVFVGFSALNKCEKSLLRHIRDISAKRNSKCLFFWDADEYYIKNKEQEAGLFLRNDIREFPHPKDFILSNSIKDLAKRDIQTIEVPTSIAQVKLIPELLKQYEKIDGNTAIILGDEKLLVPLIHTLPETLTYNITMGYPLSYTASASFVQIVMKLAMHRTKSLSSKQIFFNRKDIYAAIMHNFSRSTINAYLIDKINDVLKKNKIDYINIENIQEDIKGNPMLEVLFDTEAMDKSFPAYIISACKFVYENILCHDKYGNESDFMHRIITLYTSFLNVLDNEIAFEKDNMYYKLMTSIIKQNSMTFDGKSDDKLQILGFMETRSIDFENVIMLSMNEDSFPKSNYKDSMIPYNLRKAFSMPSIEFQNSIFAYYFYRLLQRSKNIRMLYFTENKISHAEKSRFITQVEYELLKSDENKNYHFTKSYEIHPSQAQTIKIAKTQAIMDKIAKRLGSNDKSIPIETRQGVFPSLINTYIACPVKFFFNYIEDIKEEKSIDDDTSVLDFGNLLHISCYFLYEKYIGKTIQKNDFKNIRNNVENAIEYAIGEVFKIKDTDVTLLEKAKSNIMINPLRKYIKKIIEADENYAPFKIIDLENKGLRKEKDNKESNYSIEYDIDGQTITLKGIIDRIDLKEDQNGKILRVIDYKTSIIDDSSKTYDETFWTQKKYPPKEATQVLIYSEIMSLLTEYDIQPYIISVANITDGKLKCITNGEKVNIEKYNKQKILIGGEEVSLSKNFNDNLKEILKEILNQNKPFLQTENENNCDYCPYNGICNRRTKRTINN